MKRSTLLIVIAVLSEVAVGLYFPKTLYTFRVPYQSQPQAVIGRVYVVSNVTSLCDVSNISFMMHWPLEYTEQGYQLVDVDHVTGDVILRGSLDETFLENTTLDLSVNASCLDTFGRLEFAFVRVRILKSEPKPSSNAITDPDDEHIIERQCWRDGPLTFTVEENAVDIVIGDLRNPNDDSMMTAYAVERDTTGSEVISVNNVTSVMTLITPLDRERSDIVQLPVTCTIYSPSEQVVKRTTIEIHVIDVNDNPPVFSGSEGQLREIHVTKDDQIFHNLLLIDGDVSQQNHYEISLSEDTQGLLSNPKLQLESLAKGTVLIPKITTRLPKDGKKHIVDMKIRDKGYKEELGKGQNYTDTATVRFIFQGQAPTLKMDISRSATKYSKLATLSEESDLKNFSLFQIRPHHRAAFMITPSRGILYVKDENVLLKIATDVVKLDVNCSDEDGKSVQITIQVELDASDAISQHSTCVGGCAQYKEERQCTAGCGVGSSNRKCSWRPGLKTMSEWYPTCTVDRITCPDGHCDELENLDANICPQDCTRLKPTGAGILNSRTHRGITKAKGPCWCDGGNVQCNCWGDASHIIAQTNRDTTTPTTTTSTESVTNIAGTMSQQRGDDTEGCGSTCKMTIALTVLFVSTMSIISIIGCYIWRRRRARRSQILKHVGSSVSITALPSDYLEERELRTSYHTNPSPQWSPKVTLPTFANDVHVDKWEFPRENLGLEHTLGEGEFGQVVQAQALGIFGDDKYSTVAVKMLKPDASGSEYEDLWSELNLLKEVHHPHVIRLLGACTHNGPFYVIVEYCRHGSLKNFLRAARYKDRKSWDEKQDLDASDANREQAIIVLYIRDLLSFAWQIAKGMEYLSNMKFVHRDLAARNVLVADGRVLKISDFGLSRDVYEADAYLKMTKGRIPVKWMAPESLYAQIYTTKSDIWSFGILLWEIITLGANPYPGIAPERLFSLLKTGYRMDRPEDCPDEVYAIMHKCWKTEPEDRPTFTKLADILDNMLQLREGYLDLTDQPAYLEEKLNYLDSSDLRWERSEEEEGYGSITVLKPGGDNYLTPIPANRDMEEVDCEGEKGKLLPPSPKQNDIVKDSGKIPACNEDVWLLKEKTISDLNKGRSWIDNAYEIHCV